MQPYLFPYIGYFQLIHAVDLFVCCDNMQYTKKGWINRNRYLAFNKEETFTLPLQDAPQKNHIMERTIAPDFQAKTLIAKLERNYKKSSHFLENFELIKSILSFEETSLLKFTLNSIQQVCRHLGIQTKFRTTSEIPIDHTKTKEDKVIAMCLALETKNYINSSGGRSLYSQDNFRKHGISLGFLMPHEFKYTQFNNQFIPWLSIVDVLMFNSVERIKQQLNCFDISQ